MNAASPVDERPLPPGRTGFPLIGETLSFLKNPYDFVGDRAAKYGPVFRTHLLGKDTAVVVGGEAAAAFIDDARVQREGSQPANIFRLFAGPSLPHLDGAAHRDRKSLVLAAFSPEALGAYLPAIQARFEGAMRRWAARGEFGWLEELKRASLEAVAEDVMGITERAEIDRLAGLYAAVNAGFTSIPLGVPGTDYARGLSAVDQLLAFFDGVIAEHRARPTPDGLSRILASRTPGGAAIDDDQARRELHHLVIAGRVVYAHLAGAVVHLTANPEVRARAIDEVRRVCPSGELTLGQLSELPYLRRVLMEIKRLTPVVPGMFALTREDIELRGYRIPKGWAILFGLRETHLLAEAFPDPSRFDPDRFDEGRAEDKKHPHAFCPHGPGAPRTSHHCAGTDYATELAMTFMILLLRGHEWELPEQDLGFDWSQLTADLKGGLRASLRAKSEVSP